MSSSVEEPVESEPSSSSGGGAPTFAEFYEAARRELLPRLRRSVGPSADDVFGDAILITFGRWAEVAAMEAPLAWTWTVAKRLAWRQSAREARRPLLEASAVSPAGDTAPADADLFVALAELRPDHAAAFRLTQLEDHDLASAADVLGVPAATVKVWVHRSRRRVAEQTSGLAGRWVSEQVFSPQLLERGMVERGHAAYVDAAMACLLSRPVRWELHIDRGRYWCGTDDGERLDFGDATLGVGRLNLQSIATVDYLDGVKKELTPGAVGWSRHRLDLDGDRLRMSLVSTQIPPLNGVPDEVFQHTIYDGIAFRWQGRSTAA